MLSYRDFMYVGEPIPALTSQEHSAFLMLLQESILLSLKDRNLLDSTQFDRCLNDLNEQSMREQLKRRQA